MREVDPEAAESERVAAIAEADRRERIAGDPGPPTNPPKVTRQLTKAEQDWEHFQRIKRT